MLTLRKRGLLLEYSGLGVWRYLKNVDEVMSPRFLLSNRKTILITLKLYIL